MSKCFPTPARHFRRSLIAGMIAACAMVAPPAHAALTPPDTSDMIARVMPSVVNITIVTGASTSDTHTAAGKAAAKTPTRMVGSGFIIDPSGLIVTNKHVVAGAARILVTLSDRSVWRAKVIGMAAAGDIALISIHADHPLQPAELGDSAKTRIGDAVVAIGNPLGLSGSVTGGMVSALNRDIHSSPFDNFIQTDAAINHGSSGGPLFDLQGRVIGMNTALDSPTADGGSIGIGFSMPINDVMFVIGDIRKYGEVRAGWIGVKMQPVMSLVAKAIGLATTDGAIVTEVLPNTPAAAAGLQQGDVVLDFNHETVPDVRALMRMAGETLPGTKVTLTVWRDGASRDQDVTLARFPEDGAKVAMLKPPSANPDATPDYGLHLASISPALRRQYKLAATAQGVVVTKIDTDGEAADTSLTAGDVIVKAENQPINAPRDVFVALNAAHEAGKDAGILLVRHDSDFRWIGIHLVGKR